MARSKMSSQRDNHAALVDLETFLDHTLQPRVMEGLLSIRQQAEEITRNDTVERLSAVEVTKQLLGEIKNWTQLLLDEEVRRIEGYVSFLQQLLTAIFIMKVKVLSCINVKQNESEFPVKIPGNAKFVHQIYANAGNLLLMNSHLINDMPAYELSKIIKEAISRACFACVEWTELLNWALGGVDVNDIARNINKTQLRESEELNNGNGGDESFDKEDVADTGTGDDIEDDEFDQLSNSDKALQDNDNDDTKSVTDSESGFESVNNDASDEDASRTQGDSTRPENSENSENAESAENGDVKHVSKDEDLSFFDK